MYIVVRDIVCEHFDQVELLTERERKTSVHAVRDTELAVIPVGLLDFIKAKYPGTVAKLIQILSQKMMTQHEDLNSSEMMLTYLINIF